MMCVSLHAASNSDLKRSSDCITLQAALQYNPLHKIVYFGVGTYTDVDHADTTRARIGRWQYLPKLLQNAMEQHPQTQGVCINIDTGWNNKTTQALDEYAKQLNVDRNRLDMRTVGRHLTHSDQEAAAQYLGTVVQNGGAVIIGYFAAHTAALWLFETYNKLAQKYPQSICLIGNAYLWNNGAQYSIYDAILMRHYLPSIDLDPGIMHKLWSNHQQNKLNTQLLEKIIKKHVTEIQDAIKLTHNLVKGMSAATTAATLGMPSVDITTAEIYDAILNKHRAGYAIPSNYPLSIKLSPQHTFTIATAAAAHHPDFNHLSTLDSIAPRFCNATGTPLKTFSPEFINTLSSLIEQARVKTMMPPIPSTHISSTQTLKYRSLRNIILHSSWLSLVIHTGYRIAWNAIRSRRVD